MTRSHRQNLIAKAAAHSRKMAAGTDHVRNAVFIDSREGFNAPDAKHCQYPQGERPDYNFCGDPIWKRSYCKPHFELCNQADTSMDAKAVMRQKLRSKGKLAVRSGFRT